METTMEAACAIIRKLSFKDHVALHTGSRRYDASIQEIKP